MTLEELIALYRFRAQDKEEPHLCDDDTVRLYLKEAQDEACRRGQLLLQSTGAMCQVQFQAGAELIQFDRRVLKVLRSYVDGCQVRVVPVDVMDLNHPNWQFDSQRDKPRVLISGLTTDALHLWPIPNQSGEVRLSVQRLPMKPMVVDSDRPEIREEAHPALVEWVIHRVYGTQDVDLYDPNKSETALRKFEAEFGKKSSLRNENWVRDGAGALPAPLA
ncbi:DUF6682 family protein [Comamonas testosteroni]|uniref:phage adaptor protein n=1 Tax=Comamonas testosteroni TaxID=285 RepID=UPI0005B4C5E9|nr:DUF6682 family protein [Comamonas testosteroni]